MSERGDDYVQLCKHSNNLTWTCIVYEFTKSLRNLSVPLSYPPFPTPAYRDPAADGGALALEKMVGDVRCKEGKTKTTTCKPPVIRTTATIADTK